MFEVFILGVFFAFFLVTALMAIMLRNRMRANPECLEYDAPLKEIAGILFKKNKSGILSFSPLVSILFFSTFFLLFSQPFFNLFKPKEDINPELVEYIKNTGGMEAWKQMSPAQLEAYEKKIKELEANKH